MLGLTNTADVFCKKGVRGYVSKTALNAKEACLKDTALEDWALGSWSRSIYEYAEYQLYGYYYGWSFFIVMRIGNYLKLRSEPERTSSV